VAKGRVIVVGDSLFATNQNLENEGGEPFEGLHENADFWRWLLTRLRGEPDWVPPAPQPLPAPDPPTDQPEPASPPEPGEESTPPRPQEPPSGKEGQP
jgi:hypothetical protein